MKEEIADGPRILFRPMEKTEFDLHLLLACFNANGLPKATELARWQYFEPAQGLMVDLATAEESSPKLAAAYAVFPILMKLGARRRVLGAQSLDTITDANFRGKGLFVKLARRLYSRIESQQVELVYGFPNGSSAHGFFNRLEWSSLDPVPFLIKPLRVGLFVRRSLFLSQIGWLTNIPLVLSRRPRLRKGEELRVIPEPSESFDHIWNKFSEKVVCGVERDASYLTWRLRRPNGEYEIIGLFAQEELRGYVITSLVKTARSVTAKIMELLFDPADSQAGAKLLGAALERVVSKGAQVAWAWSFDHSPNRAAFRRARFWKLPRVLRRAELHVGARPLGAGTKVHAGERANWYISLLDSDTD
jgi:hypothetical protein